MFKIKQLYNCQGCCHSGMQNSFPLMKRLGTQCLSRPMMRLHQFQSGTHFHQQQYCNDTRISRVYPDLPLQLHILGKVSWWQAHKESLFKRGEEQAGMREGRLLFWPSLWGAKFKNISVSKWPCICTQRTASFWFLKWYNPMNNTKLLKLVDHFIAAVKIGGWGRNVCLLC